MLQYSNSTFIVGLPNIDLKIYVFPKEKRLSTIADALLEFDHKNKDQHDVEIQAGAANVLYQKLAFVMHTTPHHHYAPPKKIEATSQTTSRYSEIDHEIAMICTALEMVYRANDSMMKKSYDEIGEDILPLLIRTMNRPFQLYHNAPKNGIPKDQKVSIQKITKVLAAFSLIPSAKYEMAHAPNLLPTLIQIMDTQSSTPPSNASLEASYRVGMGHLLTEATRFNAIAIMTNLAHADGNKLYMMEHPNLMPNLCHVAQSDPNELAQRCSSLALMNLSHGDDSHVPDMTGHEYMLETLWKLLQEDPPEIRRNAAVSLYNLACSDRNADLMARFQEGVLIEALVQVLHPTSSKKSYPDKLKSSAAETLFNMSCSKQALTTVRMANHPSLLEGLSNTIQSPENSLDVKLFCAATIRRLAEVIEHPMLCLGSLFAALVKGQNWTQTDDIAQGFVLQAKNVEHRKMMVFHHGLLSALADMAILQGDDEYAKIREHALSTIALLSSEYETRSVMSRHEGVMMALTRASYRMKENVGEEEYVDPATGELVREALKNLVAQM